MHRHAQTCSVHLLFEYSVVTLNRISIVDTRIYMHISIHTYIHRHFNSFTNANSILKFNTFFFLFFFFFAFFIVCLLLFAEQLKVKDIRFLSNNLTTLEILQLCNKHVSPLAPEEEEKGKVLTKAEKQKLAGGAGGKKVQKKK